MRHVFLFNPENEAVPTWISDCLTKEWNVHPVKCSREVNSLSESFQILAGLMVFPLQIAEPVLHTIESLLHSKKKIKWVGIIDRDLLSNQTVLQIISDSFFDYLSLPLETQRLSFVLGHAWGMAEIGLTENQVEDPPEEGEGLELVGTCPPMKAIFGLIRKFAQVDMPVLVTGETGTGKELVSRAIHDHSSRAPHAFIAVNCGALPGNLIQSELFGHEKGAFTGAHQKRVGRIEAASGGTIFLDEIGDLQLDLQTNLLRFLQEKTFERVGGVKTLTADVRVIAATNVDLEKAVRDGKFREDLFYRLNVLNIAIPPLRDRREDLPVLAKFFLEKFSKENPNCRVKGFSQKAVQAIQNHDWPGNVRELINRVRRGLVMCEDTLISSEDLELAKNALPDTPIDLKSVKSAIEKKRVLDVLDSTRFNISRAAGLLGISRVTLYNLIERYGIEMKRSK